MQQFHTFFPKNIRRIVFRPEALSESTSVLNNPYQGFYQIVRYTLTDHGQDPDAPAPSRIREYNRSLVLLEINLRKFNAGVISGPALAQLEQILKDWSQSGAQMILRFLYDWHGIAKATEPNALSVILTHIDQISAIVNRYAAFVYLMQGIFVGNWGEMHGSHFLDTASVRALMTRLHERIAPSVYLSVRTPAQWRMITGLYDVPAKFPVCPDGTSITGRLGLYNDGMLGSLSDLGTYGDTSRKNASAPAAKGTREEEIAFQHRLCRSVPNGGEVVANSSLNDLPAAVRYLQTIHASYLNGDYDPAVLEKWRQSVWQEKDCFSGCDGFTYVQAHLGYRYTARRFTLRKTGFLQPKLTFRLTLANTGFGNALKPFQAAFLLRNAATGELIRRPFPFDFRTLKSGQLQRLTASLAAKDLPHGTYSIFLSVTDPATGRQISLANTAYVADTGLLLGQLDV